MEMNGEKSPVLWTVRNSPFPNRCDDQRAGQG